MSSPNEEALGALIPVTILGSRWLRGGPEGLLLHPESKKMCCLGFCALALGHTEDELRGCEMPNELIPKIKPFPAEIPEFYSQLSESETYRAASFNDDPDLTDNARVRRLKPVLRKLGFSPTFDLDH